MSADDANAMPAPDSLLPTDRLEKELAGLSVRIGHAGVAPPQDFKALCAVAQADRGQEIRRPMVCAACGVESILPLREAVGKCPGCQAVLVAPGGSHRHVKPQAVVPFYIERHEASELLVAYLKKRGAGGKILKEAGDEGRLLGLYVPYWAYSGTVDVYFRPQPSPGGSGGALAPGNPELANVSALLEAAKLQQQAAATAAAAAAAKGEGGAGDGLADLPDHTAEGPSTKPALHFALTDFLTPDSHFVDDASLHVLEPWDFDRLVPYRDAAISPYQADCYRDGPEQSLLEFRERVRHEAFSRLKEHYPDSSRVDDFTVELSDITVRALLLPVWVFTHSVDLEVSQFLVNAQTGEVHGKVLPAGCAGPAMLVAAVGLGLGASAMLALAT